MTGKPSWARPLTRRQWLAAAGIGAAAIVADSLSIEPNQLEVTTHRFGAGASSGAVARLVQLSDLHLRRVEEHENRVARAVRSLDPDLLLLTGDLFDDEQYFPLLDRFLALLDPRTPTLAILGNWEHWSTISVPDIAEAYARRGFRLLVNETVTVPVRGRTVTITGLDDMVAGLPSLSGALAGVIPSADHLLLEHCPGFRNRLREGWGEVPLQDHHFTAMLAGHTHGGQIAPFGWAPVLPQGSGGYVRGWYRDGKLPLYVSRGIGMTGVQARLGSVPEVAYFEWELS